MKLELITDFLKKIFTCDSFVLSNSVTFRNGNRQIVDIVQIVFREKEESSLVYLTNIGRPLPPIYSSPGNKRTNMLYLFLIPITI